jgi:hypothetical protein
MKIVKLTAENIKKIRAVAITPQGNVVQITGANASGKTSVLDCIYFALAGAAALPSKPIREGEESAKIILDLGECVVTRKFTSDGKTTLVVEAQNGSRFPSPQKMLDSLLSGLSFDPLAFTRFEAKKQLETLKSLVTLDTDVDALDGQNQRDYETRTETNREVVRLKGQLAGVKIPDVPLTDLELDESALLKEMEEAATINSNISRVRANASEAGTRRVSLSQQVELAKATLTRLTGELQKAEAAAQLADQQVAQLREPIDIGQVRFKVERARNAATSKRAIAERDRLTALLQAKGDEADQLTQAMALRIKQKEEAIARAEMPVKGLSFGEGEVLFKGVPFAQASSAEQLVVSTVLAMRANPKLRVIRIQDGSLLDSHNLELIGKLAERGDYQVWIESLSSSDPCAVHMSEGEIVPTKTKLDIL